MKAAVLEMSIVDDPMLALIIRFVTGLGDVDASNEEFIIATRECSGHSRLMPNYIAGS